MPMTISGGAFRHFTWHSFTRRSLKIFNVCLLLKNHERVHVKHEICIFVLRSGYLHMRTDILDLEMQIVSPVVLIVMVHKSVQIIYIFKNGKKI